uniref:vitamin-K-epoxide reductase (warfarin-sensitive) n=1 Tax=Arcella intermedia TaxID=1963864 RepID=A0A6B2LP68_9EUKA
MGILVSLYGIYVEVNASNDSSFSSWCDLSSYISCSKVLTSEYSRIIAKIFRLPEEHPLNVPNTYIGILFYLAVLVYPIYPFTLVPYRKNLFFIASSISLMFCIYLAYILYFVLEDLCLVCVSTYVVNANIFYHSYLEFTSRKTNQPVKTKSK